MTPEQIRDLIRRYFATYLSVDRDTAEALLAADLRFTSPYDDHIDRATYFERCWRNAGQFESIEIEKIFVDGEECLVLYEAKTRSGTKIRNTELIRVAEGKIRSIEVFFGRPPGSADKAAEAARIRGLLEDQAAAIRDGDVEAVLRHFAPDTLTFDVLPPLGRRGKEETRARLEAWLAAYDGPVAVEDRDREISAAGDLAFCHGLRRISGRLRSGTGVDMWVRMTLCLRQIDGDWLIVHSHLSDPLDPETGMALTGLKP
ncbi:MAG TPA: nuclear transport factor 2 family protein [Paracoccaceae bacterium]|nr:nuclear transport factor 2 family protein [Paracoccaceae bacterium]